ncbi:cytochrome B (plasmid) [Sphingobium sp. SCG-1]|uniref:cytochrome b n=1 Tax=Sphingobium sp. SCG-1 TaxID=2072936 RepID=UPI000CD6805C|nr:cytochrome b [Sphingobium sp. SCG-1]AUW60480.1 cytochrome B [Sphingobium sp. SCG-1]AUW60645.1 cytochrome B [Sphingobium sp. SCG-1]
MSFSAETRYDRVAQALHWIIALLVIGNLVSGFASDALKPIIRDIVAVHKSTGLTIFALSVVRIGWRIAHPRVARGIVAQWEKVASGTAHWLFYGLLFLLPLTGWVFTSAGKYPLSWFWLVSVPKLHIQKGDGLVLLARSSHELLGIVFAVLAGIHIAAALRHHFILRDQVLSDMLRSKSNRTRSQT